ncbi:MAG: ribonuclease P protein component [Acidobacteriota bacterium]
MPAGSGPSDEGLRRTERLRRRADYQRCYRRGRRRHGSYANLHYHPSDTNETRLGITASRKVGKAVVRQRVKRRIREIFRRWPQRRQIAAIDVVVHVKPAAASAGFDALSAEIERMLQTLPRRMVDRSPRW